MEVANLVKALEAYKLEFGEYPPDFTTGEPVAEINRHLMRNFRYRNPNLDDPSKLAAYPVDLTRLDPMEALYFWLRGFSPDVQRPISGQGERKKWFAFEQTRLTDRDGDLHPEYVPPRGNDIPYLYYRHQTYVQATNWAPLASNAGIQLAMPYRSEVSSVAAAAAKASASPDQPQVFFANPETFQIISAGLDGEFGTGGGLYPGGQGYTPADRDNITSISQASTLEDDIP